MISADALYFVFATIATIVATLTGLIGAFSTFRLQDSAREINLLKNIVLKRKVGNEEVLLDLIKRKDYSAVEQIYDRTMAGADLLKKFIEANISIENTTEILLDIDNIRRNQILYEQKKKLTLNGFIFSLIFVLLSVLLLLFTDFELQYDRLLP